MSDDVRPEGRRRAARTALVVVGGLCLLLSLVATYVRDSVLDSDEFADRVVEATATPEIQAEIADTVVDQIVAADTDLLLIRPVIHDIVMGVVESPTFESIVRFGVSDLHRTVFSESEDTVTVQLVDMVHVAKISLAKIDAEAAAVIPEELTDALITLRADAALVDATQFVVTVEWLAFLLPVAAFVCFFAAVWSARDRRRALALVGIAGVGAGIALAIVEAVGRAVVIRRVDSGRPREISASIWDALAGDIQGWALVVTLAGVIVAGAAVVDLKRFDRATIGEAVLSVVTPPTTRRRGVMWAGAVGLAGLLLILEWELAVRLVTTMLGAALLVLALAELRRALARPREPGAVGTAEARSAWRTNGAWALGGVASLLALAIVLVAIARSGDDETVVASGDPGCNGSVLLCDRTVDTVAFATTHNSMAAANDGFSIGYQTVGIVEQLELGYRGFLIDAYFGLERSGGDLVLTDRAPLTDEERAELVAEVGESVVRSAEALRENRERVGDTRDVYLCHSFCEAGAVLMADELGRIDAWLDAHPREILLFVVQDEGPTADDIERGFEDSGLIDRVHTQAIGDPWPTLGEMVESGRRIWVSAENNPGDLAWYHDAFTHVQDTPHSATSRAEFSCELFRGSPASPLFLINHWLSPASPTAADEANDREVLEERLADCDDERGLFPNMIAIDFAERGDLLEIVDEINGVPVDRSTASR